MDTEEQPITDNVVQTEGIPNLMEDVESYSNVNNDKNNNVEYEEGDDTDMAGNIDELSELQQLKAKYEELKKENERQQKYTEIGKNTITKRHNEMYDSLVKSGQAPDDENSRKDFLSAMENSNFKFDLSKNNNNNTNKRKEAAVSASMFNNNTANNKAFPKRKNVPVSKKFPSDYSNNNNNKKQRTIPPEKNKEFETFDLEASKRNYNYISDGLFSIVDGLRKGNGSKYNFPVEASTNTYRMIDPTQFREGLSKTNPTNNIEDIFNFYVKNHNNNLGRINKINTSVIIDNDGNFSVNASKKVISNEMEKRIKTCSYFQNFSQHDLSFLHNVVNTPGFMDIAVDGESYEPIRTLLK